jgi:hypothetical protein
VLCARHRHRGGKDHGTRCRFHLQHACQVMQLSKTRSSLPSPCRASLASWACALTPLGISSACNKHLPIPTWVCLSTGYHPPLRVERRSLNARKGLVLGIKVRGQIPSRHFYPLPTHAQVESSACILFRKKSTKVDSKPSRNLHDVTRDTGTYFPGRIVLFQKHR